MTWTVPIEHDPADPDTFGAVVPFLSAGTAGGSRAHALDMARDVIAITPEDMVANNRPITTHEYLPTLAMLAVEIPTADAVLRASQEETAFMAVNGTITVRAAAAHFGLTIVALRPAACDPRAAFALPPHRSSAPRASVQRLGPA